MNKTILDILRQFYRRLQARDSRVRQIEAQLRLAQQENRNLLENITRRTAQLLSLETRLAELEEQVQELQERLKPPAPPSYLEVIPLAESEASLREIFGNILIYGLDDNVNDVPLLSEVLHFNDQAGVYEMKWTPERSDCDNFTRGLKGKYALAPGWGGVHALDLNFRRPIPPFGMEGHSEFLTLVLDDREGGPPYPRRWVVIEGQEKEVYEIAAELFEGENEAYLIK